jgi:galactokinase
VAHKPGRDQRSSIDPKQVTAFAPGRVNLIGEHTDYNHGLALPFAIAEGVTVHATAAAAGSPAALRIEAYARDLDEHDEFPLAQPAPAPGWRAFLRGTVAELTRVGYQLAGARLEIGGNLAQGAGLSSSAALEVALCLALLALSGDERTSGASCDRLSLARLCSRVESEWVGARTGLLDQIASLYGAPDTALRIDFRTLEIAPVPLRLPAGWQLATLDSGERHANASSSYNERRGECFAASELLGVTSLRAARPDAVERLPEPLRRRARHVLGENARVEDTIAALKADDLPAVGALLNASHASLRDLFEVSSPAVEAAVAEMLAAGAVGARIVGGGFGGHVLGLLAPGVRAPGGAREVRPGPGAHLHESGAHRLDTANGTAETPPDPS